MNVPDRNTIWRFEERIGGDGATALLHGVDAQLYRHGSSLEVWASKLALTKCYANAQRSATLKALGF